MTPALDCDRLLRIWERAADLSPAGRSLALLAGLSNAAGSAGALPAGERDRRLLFLRKELFGDRIDGVTECPECGVRVEFCFSVSEMASAVAAPPPNPLLFDRYQIHWRLPTAQDLAELADAGGPARVRAGLLERCLIEVRRDEQAVAPGACPPGVVQHVCAAMAQADPLGAIHLNMECPECANAWTPAFDIGSFLWREIDVWAKRLLRDVHQLAAAYGWSERDVLAMSAQRRRSYLELAEA